MNTNANSNDIVGDSSGGYTTQNGLLLKNLLKFYEQNDNLNIMLQTDQFFTGFMDITPELDIGFLVNGFALTLES